MRDSHLPSEWYQGKANLVEEPDCFPEYNCWTSAKTRGKIDQRQWEIYFSKVRNLGPDNIWGCERTDDVKEWKVWKGCVGCV